MSLFTRLLITVFALGLFLPAYAAEPQPASVITDRVNVRGQAKLNSEVITQLKKGETVSVLEEITLAKHKEGEPSKWCKILLPANTPVWVNTGFIEAAGKTVKPRRLNVRAGPGENYSVLARLERGATVKEIRTVGEWMEIEAPAGTYGFVAAALLSMSPPAPAPEIAAVTPTPIAAPVPVVEKPVEAKVVVEPPVAVATPVEAPKDAPKPVAVPANETKEEPAKTATPVAVVTPPPSNENKDEPAPKRVIAREGRIRRSMNIQAPAFFSLEGTDNKKMINYLDPTKLGIKLDSLESVKVLVTGEEVMDQRWPRTPVIILDDLRLIP